MPSPTPVQEIVFPTPPPTPTPTTSGLGITRQTVVNGFVKAGFVVKEDDTQNTPPVLALVATNDDLLLVSGPATDLVAASLTVHPGPAATARFRLFLSVVDPTWGNDGLAWLNQNISNGTSATTNHAGHGYAISVPLPDGSVMLNVVDTTLE